MKKLFILLLLVMTACQTNKTQLKPTTISQEYPGSIMNVTKVELIDGSSGKRVSIDEKKEIDKFLSDIKDEILTPDDNQEPRTGYLFRIALYEGTELKIDFIPNSIHNTYYKTNENLYRKLKEIFTNRFGKQF